MTVLVDTSIWSLALRRSPRHLTDQQHRLVERWSKLVREGRAALIGPIRQELLSGVRHEAAFEMLRERLAAFEELPLESVDYEQAARFFNHCRHHGITGTPIDLLICAVADRFGLAIFTTDHDFELYAKRLPIRLHVPRRQPG